MNSLDYIVDKVLKVIKKDISRKTIGYDTVGIVKRLDGNIVWVQFDKNSSQLTPVNKSINCEKGDLVRVRVSNGSAFIVGNDSKPPTDDTKAVQAEEQAEFAVGKVNDAEAEAIAAQEAADAAMRKANQDAIDMAAAVLRIDGDIENLQEQVDGNITTWFYSGAPTLNDPPVALDPDNTGTGWDTDEKKNDHLGDLYYDTATGYGYRFIYENNAYSWLRMTDSDVAEALNKASKAQDTADSKRRVFFTTPVPPYDAGDLWVQGSGGDILRCAQPKTESGSYSVSDWVLASKYTDDTRADAAYTLADNAMTSANGKNKVYHQASQPTGGTYITGDTWFDTDDGYKMYTYNGTSWVAEQFGNAAISDLSITNAKIENGTIQSAKISGLDVGKLTGGYIDASHINAGALTIGENQVTNLTTHLGQKANTADIPTKVSDLTNDSSFATTTQVSTAKGEAISTASSDATTKANDAQSAAISTAASDATTKANAAQNAAISAAATDATTKANEAATKATSYIGIETDGIKVAKNVASATSYALITSNGMQVYKSGNSIADFDDSAIRLGKDGAGNNYMIAYSSALTFLNGATAKGSIGWDSTGFYLSNGKQLKVNSSGASCDSNIYVEGLMTCKAFDNSSYDIFVTESATAFGSTAISGGSRKYGTTEVTKAKYYPLGVVGFNSPDTQYFVPTRVRLSAQSTGSATIAYEVRNVSSSSATGKFNVDILWLRVTV